MSDINIISLGGVRENGKDMYLAEIDEAIYILDCGLVYPPDEMLGIDVMIPEFDYLLKNKDRLAGVFLTHGHPDAAGALPYLLQEVDVPVFGSEMTLELVKLQAQDMGVKLNTQDFHKVTDEHKIEFSDVTVSFFNTTHSVPGSMGIVLKTDQGNIVYTGDFKFDATVSEAYRTNYEELMNVASEGVLALLSESNKADSIVDNASEATIEAALFHEVRQAKGRVVLSAVSSNIMRLQQIVNVAHQTRRHIFVADNFASAVIDLAVGLNQLHIPSRQLFQDLKKLGKYPADEIIILETGRSGDSLRSLENMARGRRHPVHIEEGDVVILATTPNADMEKAVAETKDAIYRAGGSTIEISSKYHSSGHASPKDLQFILSLLKPKYFIPVSGEYRLMHEHKKLALELGMAPQNIFLLDKGDVLTFGEKKAYIGRHVEADNVLIDGSGIGDIGNIVMRDRQMLSEDGVFVVVLTISRREKRIMAGPEVISRGFVFMKESRDLLNESKDVAIQVVNEHLQSNNFQWSALKASLREHIGKFLFKATKRRPMILPVVMEASNYRKHKNRQGRVK